MQFKAQGDDILGHAECVVELRGLVRQILQPLGPPVFDPAGAGFGGLVEKVHRFALRPEKFADRAELGLLIAELALEFDDSSLLLLLLQRGEKTTHTSNCSSLNSRNAK